MRAAAVKPAPAPAPAEPLANGAIVAVVPPEARPRPTTAQIFAPRTKDMNKGYLMFSEDDPGLTMLKDEPEDLTHLAPTAGDACIPLEDNPFDMFNDFILSDNYCSLLGDELATGSPVHSLAADSLLLSSPEPLESESSCEQSSLLTELSLDALDGTRSEGELDGRAPYIPMSGSDELPVMAPAVMWGALPDSVSLARPAPPEPPAAPALQRLLAAPPHTGPQPQDIITNIYADQGLIPGDGVSTWDTGVKRSSRRQDEPSPKRVKRSPSPAPTYSSVLMNLLNFNLPTQQQPLKGNSNIAPPTDGTDRFVVNTANVISQISMPNPSTNFNEKSRGNVKVTDPIALAAIQRDSMSLSPLSLNVSSPMYSPVFSNSLNYSPQASPALRDQHMNAYPSPPRSNPLSPIGKFGHVFDAGNNGRLLSPGGVLQNESDPFLSAKMQVSPRYLDKPEAASNVEMMTDTESKLISEGVGTSDSLGDWMDTSDILQDSGLLSPFDDVKRGLNIKFF